MEENNWSNGVQVQGQPYSGRDASFIKANSEYFDSVGTHVIMGRGIRTQDVLAAPTVAVVNQTFVKDFLPNGENPIGRHFGSPLPPEANGDYEIVGVVEDSVYTSLRWKDHRMYFVPITQRPSSNKEPIDQDLSLYAGALVLQTQWPVNNMEEIARKTLAEINPNLAVVKFQTFVQQIADRFNHDRLVAQLTALFGGLALLLNHRTVRCHCLHRRPAHFGNWHTDGPGSTAWWSDRDGHARGDEPDCDRAGNRDSRNAPMCTAC